MSGRNREAVRLMHERRIKYANALRLVREGVISIATRNRLAEEAGEDNASFNEVEPEHDSSVVHGQRGSTAISFSNQAS